MKTGWLARAGGFPVEHVPCPSPGQPVNLSAKPKGILHTTEGSTLEGALAVFHTHYAPTFTVGLDAKKRARILQHLPLGQMAAALENHSGGVETNRDVRVQIEIVGFSQKSLWLPSGPTLAPLRSLLVTLELAAGIPLRHMRVQRDAKLWQNATGWLGHVDVPENAHWDPGNIDYGRLFHPAQQPLTIAPELRPEPKNALPFTRTAKARRVFNAKFAAAHPGGGHPITE